MRPICAGISRASRFSPNRECNDSAVFSLTVNYLEENGFSVRTYTEEEFIRSDGDERWIFHMGTRDTRISGRKRIPRFYRCQFCTKHQKLSPRYSHAHITAKRYSLSRKFHGRYLDADRHASETIGHRIVLAETERYICHVSRRYLFRPNRQ